MRLSHNEPASTHGTAERPSVDHLIAELRATAALLEQALGNELQRSPTTDPNAFDYPLLARSLHTRLGNLKATIESLESARPQVSAAA